MQESSKCVNTAVFHCKKGMEAKGWAFLERECIKKANDLGCKQIEVHQNERDPLSFLWVAHWYQLSDFHKFQAYLETKKAEMLHLLMEYPKFEIYKMLDMFSRHSRKSA